MLQIDHEYRKGIVEGNLGNEVLENRVLLK